MTLNAKIVVFMDFLAILGCDTRLYHSRGGTMQLSRYAIQIENLVFVY